MISAAPNLHIIVDKSGVAWVDDTNVKVVEVMVDHLSYGHSPEEIHLQHPHLSLAQVHAAFSYYFDHQKALDAEIERRYRQTEALRDETSAPFTRKGLVARFKK